MTIEDKLREQIKDNDLLIYMKGRLMSQNVGFLQKQFKR